MNTGESDLKLDAVGIQIGEFARTNGASAGDIIRMFEIGIFSAIRLGALPEGARCVQLVATSAGTDACETIQRHARVHGISAANVLAMMDVGSFAFSAMDVFPNTEAM